MESLVDRIRKWLEVGAPPADAPFEGATDAPILDETAFESLMSVLSQTDDEEMSCEQVFAALDEYAEYLVSDQDAVTLMPLLEHHLCLCDDCRVRHESLLRILQGES